MSRVGTVGKIVLASGVVVLLCGGGYAVAYYVTNGFFDVEALGSLNRLGYGNLALAGSVVCLGVVLAIIGVTMIVVGRRR